MSRKRQRPVFDPRASSRAEVTTLRHDYPARAQVPEHFHDSDQLVFASSGVMTIRTKKELWVVPPLRAVWIPAKVPHSIEMLGVVRMRTLYIRPGVVIRSSRDCSVLSVSPFFRELILHLCSEGQLSRRKAQQKRLIGVLSDQIKVAQPVSLLLPMPTDARARKVADLILASPDLRESSEELGARTHVSKRTLERLFASETGLTFGKWKQQLRLLHGIRLISSGEKVTQAALASGYDSPSAFIAMFRNSLGVTPRGFFGSL